MHAVFHLAQAILGRRNMWRIGRGLYMKARADGPNDIRTNGELWLQDRVLETYHDSRTIRILDIGANLGDWATPLLDRAYSRGMRNLEVHAFEPAPDTFSELTARLETHPFREQIRLVSRAMSSSTGSHNMTCKGRLAGTNSLEDDGVSPTPRILIEKTTVDAYCSLHEIEMIHLLKIDTEGHDSEVIVGAQACFDAERIMICQFEYNHMWIFGRHFLRDVFRLMENRPYKVAKLGPRQIEIHDRWHPELERFFESNWLILHDSALPFIPALSGEFDPFNTFSTKLTTRRDNRRTTSSQPASATQPTAGEMERINSVVEF